jgi:hypothetical protein
MRCHERAESFALFRCLIRSGRCNGSGIFGWWILRIGNTHVAIILSGMTALPTRALISIRTEGGEEEGTNETDSISPVWYASPGYLTQVSSYNRWHCGTGRKKMPEGDGSETPTRLAGKTGVCGRNNRLRPGKWFPGTVESPAANPGRHRRGSKPPRCAHHQFTLHEVPAWGPCAKLEWLESG